ncbi:MAG TPA: YncE family protein, partial [Actinomycetes bacterium]|nr:YncE family protein [Actinomycetes bacterium]
LDPSSGEPRATITFGPRSEVSVPWVAAGDRVVAVQGERRLFLVDPATNSVRVTVALATKRGGLAAGAGAVWVTDPTKGRLLRVDPGF